ncbi:MAG: hypothetical protein R3F21_00350 [Myxococcota bacterium]
MRRSAVRWTGFRGRRRRPLRPLARLALLGALALFPPSAVRAAPPPSPPSPVDILGRRDLDAPFLDAVPICVPAALEGIVDPVIERAGSNRFKEAHQLLARYSDRLADQADALAALDLILEAREGRQRADRVLVEARLESLAREEAQSPHLACLRLERARLLLLLDRFSEAAAQLALAERKLEGKGSWDRDRRAGIAFARAEILYLSGRRFEAHMAYRKIARGEDPRLALAARLRLTDLSFDAGKLEGVSLEYESLLPRSSAFGAGVDGWSLRAAEAALDSGDPSRALRWLERHLEATSDREARDVAEIRRADLEVRLEDPLAARGRLAAVASRREGEALGTLAAVRAVDLDVFEGPAKARFAVLAAAIEGERAGLRRYALGVLLRELTRRELLDPALAVATRLAFDGVDAVVVPDYTRLLDGLLARIVRAGDAGCDASVRALGGRYGILIERATSVAPFAQLGRCFERMELPWLAVPVYRTISRRFGVQGASDIALPLARASLATGDASLARHMADAALADEATASAAWEAIVAESDYRAGQDAFASKRAQRVLDASGLDLQRAPLALAMAKAAARKDAVDDARFLAARLPDWLAREEGAGAPVTRLRLLEAGLSSAHVLRRASAHEAAFALYRAVDRHAEEGPLRSSARFWLGIARQPGASGARAWGDDVDRSLGAPWARVAGFEERFEKLRDVYAGVLE